MKIDEQIKREIESNVISKHINNLEIIQKRIAILNTFKSEIKHQLSYLKTDQEKEDFMKNNKKDIDWVNENIARLIQESITPREYWHENGHEQEVNDLLSD